MIFRGRAPRSLIPMPESTAIDLRESWQPDGSGILAADPADLRDGAGDCDAVTTGAYGARFMLAIAPGATITIWAYAIWDTSEEAGPDGPAGYQVTLCAEYRRPGGALDGVSFDTEPEFFDSPDAAATRARETAEFLATTPRIGLSFNDLQLFDWDGVPIG